jgi:hypothetical protein
MLWPSRVALRPDPILFDQDRIRLQISYRTVREGR